jgi:hypothetical protein
MENPDVPGEWVHDEMGCPVLCELHKRHEHERRCPFKPAHQRATLLLSVGASTSARRPATASVAPTDAKSDVDEFVDLTKHDADDNDDDDDDDAAEIEALERERQRNSNRPILRSSAATPPSIIPNLEDDSETMQATISRIGRESEGTRISFRQ